MIKIALYCFILNIVILQCCTYLLIIKENLPQGAKIFEFSKLSNAGEKFSLAYINGNNQSRLFWIDNQGTLQFFQEKLSQVTDHESSLTIEFEVSVSHKYYQYFIPFQITVASKKYLVQGIGNPILGANVAKYHSVVTSAKRHIFQKNWNNFSKNLCLDDLIPKTLLFCKISNSTKVISPEYATVTQVLESCNTNHILIPNQKAIIDVTTFYPFSQNHSAKLNADKLNLMRSKRNADEVHFQEPSYSFSVAENEPSNTFVAEVPAYNNDGQVAQGVAYGLIATKYIASEKLFRIDRRGRVFTNAVLDREKLARHDFRVTATKDAQQVSAVLHITVRDMNDNKPKFTYTNNSIINITENQILNSPIVRINAYDDDAGKNGRVSYSIFHVVPASGKNVFGIEPDGNLILRQNVDREKQAQYKVTVMARDMGNLPQSSFLVINVFIKDINDNFPQFSKSVYKVRIPEHVRRGTVIGNVSASDKDAGRNGIISYSLIYGNKKRKFSINRKNGSVSVKANLDKEQGDSQFSLTIRASDSGHPPKSNTTIMKINVVDENDNTPRFYMPNYHFSALESDAINTVIGQVEAFDQDTGENARISFSLFSLSSEDLEMFKINKDTGAIVVAKKLDYETKKSYQFSVRATDNGQPPRFDQAAVSISVRDVNDNAPQFSSKFYQTRIAEDTKKGSDIIEINCTDPDEQTHGISFSIIAGDAAKTFTIVRRGHVGVIKLNKKLDYNEKQKYRLKVIASDGVLQNSTFVLISVTDTNSHDPVFDEPTYHAFVKEDVPIGSFIFKVHATDDDRGENAKISYCFTDLVQSNDFVINETTGVIRTRRKLDYERSPEIMLSVKAQDNGLPKKYDVTQVAVYLLDTNDNAPVFEKVRYQASISEASKQSTEVLQIHATDRDTGVNAQIHYSFENGNDGDGHFDIDQQSGRIRIAQRLDRETVSQYHLVAYALDGGTPQLSTSVSIEVNVLDVDDNAPQFLNIKNNTLYFHVSENVKSNTVVARIQAVDPDEQQHSLIKYDLGDDPILLRQWSLDPTTGDLKPLNPLDYETENMYKFTVSASSGTLVNQALVVIIIDDYNDNSPILHHFEIVFNNYRSRTKHTFPHGTIGYVPATDEDVSDTLTYSFVSGNEENLLIMNNATGALSLNTSLDSNRQFVTEILIKVSDGLHEVKATCTLKVVGISDEMLQHSITVRVLHMNAFTFLTPTTMQKFSDGLATILNSSSSNIYIFNVQNDTDIILNVSFSAKKDFNTFFTSKYLQDQVYLNRQALVKLTGKNVLPFDDNICLREPCLNYKRCTSVLTFNSSASFISSLNMIFRPIYPVYKLKCECPIGFTNNETCADEIDLCYSSPCLNGGSCITREGGFTCTCPTRHTGKRCEIDLDNAQCASYLNLCKNGGTCMNKGSSLSCDCSLLHFQDVNSHADDVSATCELVSRQFTKGNFLMLPGITNQWHFTLSLSFATIEENGLLLYNGRLNHLHDFIALEMIGGQVQLNFSSGNSWTTVAPFIEGGLNDGMWHTVHIKYNNQPASEPLSHGILNRRGPTTTKIVTLTVDPATCDDVIAAHWSGTYGNYSCSKQVKQSSAKKSLDLTSPLFLGGVPDLPEDYQVHSKSYIGCLANLVVDGRKLDLAQFITNNGSVPGCAAMRPQCTPNKCGGHGTCSPSWNGYHCRCEEGFTGQRCQHQNNFVIQLNGRGCLSYRLGGTSNLPIFKLPWKQQLSFRTFDNSATLLYLVFHQQQLLKLTLEIDNGQLVFEIATTRSTKSLRVTSPPLNDGQWHDVMVVWKKTSYLVTATVDQSPSDSIVFITSGLRQMSLKSVYIGGKKVGRSPALSSLTGCLQDIQVGSGQRLYALSTVYLNNIDGASFRRGCQGGGCRANHCPTHSKCEETWTRHRCLCDKGYVGDHCVSACSFSLCKNGGHCSLSPSSDRGYTCSCLSEFVGEFCERQLVETCPPGWYGTGGRCAPCVCSSDLNFDQICDWSGNCSCKRHHYYDTTSASCQPCKCYSLGSVDLQCNEHTGQCRCKESVSGKQCNLCSRHAEVTITGCRVVNGDLCPKSYYKDVEWQRTPSSDEYLSKCPSGSQGVANRWCSSNQTWLEPNFSNCTSDAYYKLASQLYNIKNGNGQLVTRSVPLSFHLLDLTRHNKIQYENDVIYTCLMIEQLLGYESTRTGFSLAPSAEQSYTDNLVASTSVLLDNTTSHFWWEMRRNAARKKISTSSSSLIHSWERYMSTMIRNLNLIRCNLSHSSSPNMEALMRIVSSDDDFVYNYQPDDETAMLEVILPRVLLSSTNHNSSKAPPTVGVIAYRNLEEILPTHFIYDRTFRPLDKASINSVVVSVQFHNPTDTTRDHGRSLVEPVQLRFRLLNPDMINPKCVFWNYTARSSGATPGGWSHTGCKTESNESHVTCRCFHLTTFAVITDEARIKVGSAVVVMVAATAILSILLLLTTIISSLFLHANSVRMTIARNLSTALMLTDLIFAAGIHQTWNVYLCMTIAISLHFLLLSAFSWILVDGVHLYRKLTEQRDVNHGKTRIYFIVGWIVPSIITALSVGLDAKGYGSPSFCWVTMEDVLIWSVAGPVVLCSVGFVLIFLMSVHAFLSSKIKDSKRKQLSSEMRTSLFITISVMFGFLFATLAVTFDSPPYFYIFSLVTLLQGVLIFLFHCFLNKELRQAYRKYKERAARRTNLNTTAQPLLTLQSSLAMTPESSLGGAVMRVNMSTSASMSSRSFKATSPMLPPASGDSESGSESSDGSSDSSMSFDSSSDNEVEMNTYRNIQSTRPGYVPPSTSTHRGNGRLPSNGDVRKEERLSVKKKTVVKINNGSDTDGSNETAV